MKRKIMALGLFITLLSGMIFYVNVNADTPPIYNAEEIFEHSADAVFYVRILQNDDTVKAVGTGVLLSPDGIAVTAYHVIKGAERIEGTLNDGRVISPIEVLSYDELKDVAILKLPDPKKIAGKDKTYKAYNVLQLSEKSVKHGEKVFAIGYPLKNTPIITEGIVNTPKAEINGRDRILTSAQIVSGMSGGPILDQQGHLKGIISGSIRTMNNIHLVIDTKDLRSLLPAKLK